VGGRGDSVERLGGPDSALDVCAVEGLGWQGGVCAGFGSALVDGGG
jgi:hypothetical protein